MKVNNILTKIHMESATVSDWKTLYQTIYSMYLGDLMRQSCNSRDFDTILCALNLLVFHTGQKCLLHGVTHAEISAIETKVHEMCLAVALNSDEVDNLIGVLKESHKLMYGGSQSSL